MAHDAPSASDAVPDSWSKYEYPMLSAIARRAAASTAGFSVRSDEILDEVVRPDQANERFHFERGLVWLEEGGYITGMTGSWGRPYPQAIMGITPEGRRAIGLWPNKNTVADDLLSRLEERANNIAGSQPEKAKRLKETVSFLATGARDVLVSVVSDVAVKAAGLR